MAFIKETDTYRLYSPTGCWGTNYTIINRKTDTEYLIDIHDVSATEEEYTLLYSELLNLDPDSFLPHVWKIANRDSIQYRLDNYTSKITELVKEMLYTENEVHRDIILQDIKNLADTRQELINSLLI